MPDTANPRRWFRPRFGLRTLFVAVTMFSLWLGWNVHIVQERKAMLKRIEHSGGSWVAQGGIMTTEYSAITPEGNCVMFEEKTTIPVTEQVSWVRSLLGDQAIGRVYLRRDTRESIQAIKEMFPEVVSVD